MTQTEINPAQTYEFRLPDVGEGLTEAEILSWSVSPGDSVSINQVLVEVETAKAAVELPSPWAGTVTALLVNAGDTVPVGTPMIRIYVGTDINEAAATTDTSTPERHSVLVGYGPRTDTAPARRRAVRTHGSADTTAAVTDPVAASSPQSAATHAPLSTPPVRKLAKTLGLDLAAITPSGAHGVITRHDVEQAVEKAHHVEQAHDADKATAHDQSIPAAAMSARETRTPIRGIRKATAAAMVASAYTAPHVTEFITVDVSATMELLTRVAARREFSGIKLTPLTFVAKAVLRAAARTPAINSHWDEAAGEIVTYSYVNLGIAAATDRGLIVPNVKDADRLGLRELASAIATLTDLARSGHASPADLTGGTLTITNIGPYGVDAGTPILNPGEAAILALGAIARRPWVVCSADGAERIEPRWVTQLAVSFDHRLVDGAEGSQFLRDVADVLNDPGLAQL